MNNVKMSSAVLKYIEITITNQTAQAGFLVHMTNLGITCTAVAFYLMVGVAMDNVLKMGTIQAAQVLPASPHVLLFREGSVLSMRGS
jgi:hypothetical protein